MNSPLTAWFADDPEAGAARVGGRPVQAFWVLLRPSFRRVLVEPHRRAGGGVVGWRWTAPAEPRTPEAGELAELRARLKNALSDLAADFERREGDAGGGAPPELLTAMRNIVHGLLNLSDANLGEYAVWNEAGLLIRSWGFKRPAPAKREDTTDSSGKAHPEVGPTSMSAGADESDALRRSTTGRRLWPLRVAVLVGVVALIGAGAWLWRDTAQGIHGASPNASRESEYDNEGLNGKAAPTTSVVRKEIVPAESEKHPTRPALSNAVSVTRTEVVATGKPLGFPTFSSETGEGTSLSVAVTAGAADAGSPTILPGATLGVMPALPDRADDAAGPKSKVLGQVEPLPVVATPSGGESVEPEPPVSPGAGASQADATTTAPRVAAGDVGAKPGGEETAPVGLGERPSAPIPVIPRQPKPTASAVEAKVPPPPVRIQGVVTPETGEASANLKTKAKEAISLQTSSGPEPTETMQLGKRAFLTYTVGACRAHPLQDRVLPTWPTERAGKDVLADARAATWKQTEALCPDSFRDPKVRSGLNIRLASVVEEGRAPNWTKSVLGKPAEGDALSTDGLRISWDERTVAMGFDAQLVTRDGAVLVRVWSEQGASGIHVDTSPEVMEIALWFAVELTDFDAQEGGMRWQSRTPSWSAARWETRQNERLISVTCNPGLARTDEPMRGVIALVHPSSGWGISWPVTVRPVEELMLGGKPAKP